MEKISPSFSVDKDKVIKQGKPDLSAFEEVAKEREKQLGIADEMDPQELAKIDLRIREGEECVDDMIVIAGHETVISQLTIIDLRKAQIRSLECVIGTSLSEKMVSVSRSKNDPEKDIPLTKQEQLLLSEVSIEEDFWLVWFALKKAKHPKMTGDGEVDREWIGMLENYDDIVLSVRKANALDKNGGRKVRFFRNH